MQPAASTQLLSVDIEAVASQALQKPFNRAQYLLPLSPHPHARGEKHANGKTTNGHERSPKLFHDSKCAARDVTRAYQYCNLSRSRT
jgi:hypothetical protein